MDRRQGRCQDFAFGGGGGGGGVRLDKYCYMQFN